MEQRENDLILKNTINPSMNRNKALDILQNKTPLMESLYEASQYRYQYFGNKVRIHILDNIKNGFCPEDCGYCAQRKKGNSGIQEYPLKSEEEIWEDAKAAKANGAYRFCMVTSGTGPSEKTVHRLAAIIQRITQELGMKVCLSAGILSPEKAKILKEAGLDRYNHNLNTSERMYPSICSTHTYKDRVQTLETAAAYGIGLCSGIIVGMGETPEDIVDTAFELNRLGVVSIPVNFFIPIKDHSISNPNPLSPEYCLRILCVFRLANPNAEIRMAAGREGHLRSLQALGLYVANSLFADGYLNVKGSSIANTLQMIYDAGMEPEFADGIPKDWKEEIIQKIDKKDENQEWNYSPENFPNLYKFQKNPLPNLFNLLDSI